MRIACQLHAKPDQRLCYLGPNTHNIDLRPQQLRRPYQLGQPKRHLRIAWPACR